MLFVPVMTQADNKRIMEQEAQELIQLNEQLVYPLLPEWMSYGGISFSANVVKQSDQFEMLMSDEQYRLQRSDSNVEHLRKLDVSYGSILFNQNFRVIESQNKLGASSKTAHPKLLSRPIGGGSFQSH
jgi:hypothetical protein